MLISKIGVLFFFTLSVYLDAIRRNPSFLSNKNTPSKRIVSGKNLIPFGYFKLLVFYK